MWISRQIRAVVPLGDDVGEEAGSRAPAIGTAVTPSHGQTAPSLSLFVCEMGTVAGQ